MKGKNFNKIAIVIGILLFIALYALFHSFVKAIPYIQVLDQVLSTIINEGWKFISNPTIFIVIIIAIVVWRTRERLLSLFPAIREIKAGAFSARLDYSQINNIIKSEENKDIKPVKSESMDINSEVVGSYLIEHFTKETLNFLMALDNRAFDGADIYHKVQEFKLGSAHVVDFETLEKNTRLGFYLGIYILFYRLFFPRFYTKEDNEYSGLKFILKPKIKEQIEKRLTDLNSQKVDSL